MKETFEKLWNGYLSEECSTINSEEESALLKKADELHKKAGELLSSEENDALEKYIEALYEIQSYLIKKAFFKGCEFTASFLAEIGFFNKN